MARAVDVSDPRLAVSSEPSRREQGTDGERHATGPAGLEERPGRESRTSRPGRARDLLRAWRKRHRRLPAFNPLSIFAGRSRAEEYLARYVVRECRRGRSLQDVLEDPYVKNRATPAERARLLDRPEVVAAVGDAGLDLVLGQEHAK
jgi:hypothetical protein